MKTYNDDLAQKKMFRARFAEHRRLDEVIQGIGFNGTRGCFIGCTMDKYSHEAFDESIAPRWIGCLADRIFEGLPASEAAQFGTDLLTAIPVGVEYAAIDNLRHKLSILRLERLLPSVKNEKVIESINLVISSHKKQLDGEAVNWANVTELTWRIRRDTTDAYAYAYAYAYACADADAYAYADAVAVANASYAYAATDAARRSARYDHWRFERDNLIRLVSELN